MDKNKIILTIGQFRSDLKTKKRPLGFFALKPYDFAPLVAYTSLGPIGTTYNVRQPQNIKS